MKEAGEVCYYKPRADQFVYLVVEGERGSYHEAGREEDEDNYQVECGDFHPAADKITELTGAVNYNVKLVFCFSKEKKIIRFGVRTKDCQQVIFLSRLSRDQLEIWDRIGKVNISKVLGRVMLAI